MTKVTSVPKIKVTEVTYALNPLLTHLPRGENQPS